MNENDRTRNIEDTSDIMNDDHNNYDVDDFPQADEVFETDGQYNPQIPNPDNSNQAGQG